MATLSPPRFDTAYLVLEAGRDEFEHLTEDERETLNEAHAIVQEMEQMVEEEIEPRVM